jgi:Ca2+-binding RTX toxin-like protein
MQGVCIPGRRSRAACAAVAVAFVLLALPGAAAGFVSSRVERGHLFANSDSGSDIIRVSCGIDLLVKVNGLDPTEGPAPCGSIARILVTGGRGGDTINVSRVGPRNGFTSPELRLGRPIRAFGGDSADRISGSRLADVLAGGKGSDVVRGRAGPDVLRGSDGSDRLIGGRGQDLLLGGRGFDFLVGGADADIERQQGR